MCDLGPDTAAKLGRLLQPIREPVKPETPDFAGITGWLIARALSDLEGHPRNFLGNIVQRIAHGRKLSRSQCKWLRDLFERHGGPADGRA